MKPFDIIDFLDEIGKPLLTQYLCTSISIDSVFAISDISGLKTAIDTKNRTYNNGGAQILAP